MGMKQILVMMAAMVLVGCSKDTPKTSQAAEAEPQVVSKSTPAPTPVSPADEKLIADPIVEKAVREKLEKPEGILTEADLEKLTKLSLGGTQITDAGFKEVAKLQKLTGLDLTGTQITDVGLKELAKLHKLEQLWLLSGLVPTQFTNAGAAELKKALPNCRISGP